jgi:hypothetical protein
MRYITQVQGKVNRRQLLDELIAAGMPRDAFPVAGLALATTDDEWYIDCERELSAAEELLLRQVVAAHRPEHDDLWVDEQLQRELALADALVKLDKAREHELTRAVAYYEAEVARLSTELGVAL